jgi:hypothetical protein
MLLEEGFSVCSVDLSESMLFYAMKERWNRRKQAAFDTWSQYKISNDVIKAIVIYGAMELFDLCITRK